MSRLARKPGPIREGVTVTKEDHRLLFLGAKGEFSLPVVPTVTVSVGDGGITVAGKSAEKQARNDVGTLWSKIRTAMQGVAEGFSRSLEIEGVGYRAIVEGEHLVLSLGYVNPVRFKIPEGVAVRVEKNVIIISGIDKERVGQVAAQIRKLKRPEPYKGKGIRYEGEVVRRKVGKKAIAATG